MRATCRLDQAPAWTEHGRVGNGRPWRRVIKHVLSLKSLLKFLPIVYFPMPRFFVSDACHDIKRDDKKQPICQGFCPWSFVFTKTSYRMVK